MKNQISFLDKIYKLNNFHYNNSKKFKNILDVLFPGIKKKTLENLPFIPAKLFKEMELKSIVDKDIFKILLSSGTSGNKPSKIYLDKDNAKKQTSVLSEIVSKIIGKKRLPMLIIDEKKNILNPKKFDAKTAAILGFSFFGRDHTYLLTKGKINYGNLNNFLKKYSEENFLIFGFTSFIYEHLVKEANIKKISKDFSNGILIHGGGCKKMEKIKISNSNFKEKLNNKFNLKKIFNYYGLVEQTGSIFFECNKCSCFTPSEYSDVLIRDKNFKLINDNNKGFIQVISLLPKSYPGHSILTEDIGEIVKNNCDVCFGKKQFIVHGRATKSELRGCSDI